MGQGGKATCIAIRHRKLAFLLLSPHSNTIMYLDGAHCDAGIDTPVGFLVVASVNLCNVINTRTNSVLCSWKTALVGP